MSLRNSLFLHISRAIFLSRLHKNLEIKNGDPRKPAETVTWQSAYDYRAEATIELSLTCLHVVENDNMGFSGGMNYNHHEFQDRELRQQDVVENRILRGVDKFILYTWILPTTNNTTSSLFCHFSAPRWAERSETGLVEINSHGQRACCISHLQWRECLQNGKYVCFGGGGILTRDNYNYKSYLVRKESRKRGIIALLNI